MSAQHSVIHQCTARSLLRTVPVDSKLCCRLPTLKTLVCNLASSHTFIMTMRRLFHVICDDLHTLLLSQWLDIRSIVALDIAISSYTLRPYWMTLLRSLRADAIDNMHHSASSLMWLIERGIRASRLQMKDDAWRVLGCDLLQLQTIDLVHLDFDGCTDVSDECICNIAERCHIFSECTKVPNTGVSALGDVCGQLQHIDLRGCDLVTDVGVSALGDGCGQLQLINLGGCHLVTDAGVSALADGCVELQHIYLGYCDLLTDVGISALGHGCGQLQYIYLKGCDLLTDIGISALGDVCGQLQHIDLTGCNLVTDVGVSALGHGCVHLQHIDLGGCHLVTDVGVSALGNGCVSCSTSILKAVI